MSSPLPYTERIYTHQSSKMSLDFANKARSAVLSFFRAPSGYTVVFTSNATAALKLVGESYPFASDSSLVLGTDSHNSVSEWMLPCMRVNLR